MALNYIWIGLFAIGVIIGVVKLFLGDFNAMPEMMDSIFSMSNLAFDMTIGLTGTLTFWMGVMKVGEDSGLINRLAKNLSPVLVKLFPEIPKDHPALSSLFINISANMLGLDNAATPIGLKAMQEMQSINKQKDTASNSMIMFLTLNTSGLTIIPVSIMAYRSKFGAADPTDIFIPLLLTTMCSTLVGLLVVYAIQKINLLNKTLLATFAGISLFVAGIFTAVSSLDSEQMQIFCRVLTSILILGCIMFFLFSGVRKKINVYDSFVEGAKGGFHIAVSLIPYCVAILAARRGRWFIVKYGNGSYYVSKDFSYISNVK